MEISPQLVPVFWSLFAILAVCIPIFLVCLGILLNAPHRRALHLLWISGSLAAASAVALLIIVAH
jgi:hypothetical protein